MRDLTKPAIMGYELPLDRCPSDSDSRSAFTIGVWCRDTGRGRPEELTATNHPLLGDVWHLLAGGQTFHLQCWPHPQVANQTLIVKASFHG